MSLPKFTTLSRWYPRLAGGVAPGFSRSPYIGGILCAVALTAPRLGSRTQGQGNATHVRVTPTSRCLDAAARVRGTVRGAPRYEPSLPRVADLPEWVSSRLLMVLRTSPDPAPLWLHTAMDCDLSREELANVLYDTLLVEAARSYSLVQLTEALAVGASHATLRTATFTRALEFLLDQQLDDGFIGVNRLLAEDPGTIAVAEAQAGIAGLLEHIAGALSC